MYLKKYTLFVMAVVGIQLSFSQGPAIKVVSTNNTPALAIYGAGGAYKGYLWNKGTEDIELGTSGTTGNLHISVNGNEKVSVFKNGQVAINGAAYLPSNLNSTPVLTVNGDLSIRNLQLGNDTWTIFALPSPAPRLAIFQNSTPKTYLNDDGDWVALSDARLKQNINEYKAVLDRVKKLNISTYEFKSNTGKRSLGLIAQNVLESFPEIVSESTGKDGQSFLGIAYDKTGVLALKAIQEQQQVIESLQQKVERLEELVAELLHK